MSTTSLNVLANMVKGVIVGDNSIMISALSSLDDIQEGSLVFADGEANFQKAEQSSCAAILANPSMTSTMKSVIQVAHPLQSFIQLLHFFYPSPKVLAEIHPSAVIAKDVVLGKNIAIGPFVVIESGAKIGDNCILKSHVHIGHNVQIGSHSVLHPHVIVYAKTKIGERVSIHASSVIGSDGFGYTFVEGQHLKIPHVGSVIIEDDVEIGANSVIDRATIGATVIGKGTKIDNLVQIAHSVKLGKHNILCAFTGIAGSSVSGDGVIFAANVGVSDHVKIDDGVILAARAGVPPKKHLKAGNIYLGNPARPKEKALEQEFATTRIPMMRKNIKNLSEKMNAMEERLAELLLEDKS